MDDPQTTDDPQTEPDTHTVPLSQGWSLWRTFCLRGAGFPVHLLKTIHAPSSTTEFEMAAEQEHRTEGARQAAVEVCRRAEPEESAEHRRLRRRAKRKLKKGSIPDLVDQLPAIVDAVSQYAQQRAGPEELQMRVDQVFEQERVEISRGLHELCELASFREALVWQNRRAVETGLNVLARKKDDFRDTSQRRSLEEVVVKYLQRFAAKNDSVGFFGPIGWGSWVSKGSDISMQPGPTLLKRRETYFEYWAIDAVGKTLARDPRVKLALAPRLHPLCRLESSKLVRVDRSMELPPGLMLLLRTIDGKRSAEEIAATLVADRQNDFALKQQVWRALQTLEKRRAIIWSVSVPLSHHPERDLRRLLESGSDKSACQTLLRPLMELERERGAVSRATGNSDALNDAMGRMETTFERFTGRASNQHAGEMYAGRTLVFEDCQRHMELTVGGAVLEALRGPLPLMLNSSLWFLSMIAERFEKYVEEVFSQLESASSGTRIWFDRLLVSRSSAEPIMLQMVDDAVAELQRRWLTLVEWEGDPSRVELRSRDLELRRREIFPVAQTPWPSARYHSPDILIAAESAAAIHTGQFQMVLGEMHAGINSVSTRVFASQFPEPEHMCDWIEQDLQRPRVLRGMATNLRGYRVIGHYTLSDGL